MYCRLSACAVEILQNQMKPTFSEVHPELRQIAAHMPAVTLSRRNFRILRFLTKGRWGTVIPKGVRIENIYIAGRSPERNIRLRLYRGASMAVPAGALIWLHGGGFVSGSPEGDDGCCSQYAHEAGILVVSVDYRLAPEHPFPAALDDVQATFEWVAAQAGKLGVDPARIAIGGASAGGGLAAGLAQRLRDQGGIKPSFQLLIYPMLDDRTTQGSDPALLRYHTWNPGSNRFGWQSYLGTAYPPADVPAYAVPARRADLSGLPPAWIGVGSLDLFCRESSDYAQLLTQCGVSCQLEVVAGAFHGFDEMAPRAEVVKAFRRAQVEALKRALG